MKTGIELIAQERAEQIEKHGYTIDHDIKQTEIEGISPLRMAAVALIHPTEKFFPMSWSFERIKYIQNNKSYKDKLIIAGALIAAEIDRLNSLYK